MTKLNQRSRILILVASLLLGLSFLFPLWQIEIWAPQYPEGLFMQIWTSKIAGDVRNINILNHYIGMHAITPTDIPELSYFPKIFAGLLLFGLLTAIVGRRILHYLWTGGLVAFALWALHDFWAWEYRYGHDLNPNAAIKMDDMNYQPPLIGSKELLNITAWSLPHVAGYAFMLAIALAVSVYWVEFRPKRGV